MVAPEVYQQVGRVRTFAAFACLLLNLVSYFSINELGLDRQVWLAMQVPNNLAIAGSLAIGLWCWKSRASGRALRRATLLAIPLEVSSFLVNFSLYGSVNSHMLFAGVVVVLGYRAIFDFRIGAYAFGLLFVGTWALAIGEMIGLLQPQCGLTGPTDAIYASAQRQLVGALAVLSVILLAFWGTNWLVLRVRHHEQAVRILREALAATDGGKLGRHTGRTLNDTYLVGALIGSGGMGEVYRGTHRRTQRPVAIKMLHPHLVDDPVLLARFRREAEIAGSLGSDHIVEVIDIDRDGDDPFMVLELLEGENLAEYVQRLGPLPVEVAAEIFDQVAQGLAAAHAVDIVHRDLKPDNIHITDAGGKLKVTLLDFGISKIINNATAITREAAVIGTPHYMSPEQATGVGDDIDARADIFGFAAVVFYALSGRPPFASGSIPVLLARICNEEPPSLGELRPDLAARGESVEAVLAIAMAKKRSQRYATATEFAADLRDALTGERNEQVLERAAKVERGAPCRETHPKNVRMATEDTAVAQR